MSGKVAVTPDRVEHPEFFLVWCPDGTRPPSVSHDTQDEAERVAGDMARRHKGKRFYVLCAVSEFLDERPIRLSLGSTKIPF